MTGHKSVQAAPLTYCLRLPQCHSRKVDIHPSHCLSPSVLAAEQKIKHLKRGSRNYTTDPARDKLWRVLDVPPNVHLCCESRKPTQGMSILEYSCLKLQVTGVREDCTQSHDNPRSEQFLCPVNNLHPKINMSWQQICQFSSLELLWQLGQ